MKKRFHDLQFKGEVTEETLENNKTFSFGLVENNYKGELNIDIIIEEIVKLLENPEEDFVVNREAYEMFKRDKSAFLDKPRASETGNNDYNEYLYEMKFIE